ncbi:hypothetical protein GCM10022288_15680 [Gryllotalpicola kribbensis]|uniref:FRG domain-containing protein n=1 Tax=Gryllotalpicola kribbensis TaxID=993084 RepID=A0ABP8ARJ4_9MICO
MATDDEDQSDAEQTSLPAPPRSALADAAAAIAKAQPDFATSPAVAAAAQAAQSIARVSTPANLPASNILAGVQKALAAYQAALPADLYKNIGLGSQLANMSGLLNAQRLYKDSIGATAAAAYPAVLADAMKSISAAWAPIANPRNYERPDPPKAAYSEQLTSPGEYFRASGYEVEITSFAKLNSSIEVLIRNNPKLGLVWRGMRNAEWGVYSSLFRKLINDNGVRLPEQGRPMPRGEQPFPDENQMVVAEAEILRVAREEWRLDDLSALEIFARIQHAGGPTRLIDVTQNPYVAAWFAVEEHPETEDDDARLLAFATRPIAKDGDEAPDSLVRLDSDWADRVPLWHGLTGEGRPYGDWGTGTRRYVWFPPLYDPRISAQNAAFILDGVPITSEETAKFFPIKGTDEHWTRADLLAASSIYVRLANPKREARSHRSGLAPTFTFRITADAKHEIREVLEQRFGYTHASIYPDSAGLADRLNAVNLDGS